MTAAVLLALLVGSVAAAAPPLEVRAARVGAHQDYTRLVLETTSNTPYRLLVLAKPDRVVIDLLEFAWKADDPKASGLVGALRYGVFNAGVGRIVIDATKPVAIRKHFIIRASGAEPWRLVVDLEPRSGPAAAATIVSNTWGAYQKTLGKATSSSPSPPSPPSSAPPASQAPRKHRLPLVAVDAGHGGPDPGTIGIQGTREKDITLAAALLLADRLKKTGRYRVLLTRDRDVYIPLRQRHRVAEVAGADLFISLHADSAPGASVRGVSIYTLSEKASDAETEKLAAKENRSDIIAGIDLSGYDETVAHILLDFESSETMKESWYFAESLLPSLDRETPLLRNPHRSAGFAVLKSPTVPSVLVEMGYLSNRADEKLLRSSTHRERLARAMVNAIDAYFERRRRMEML